MPTLTVRDIPATVYARLKEQAATHRRSMSNEIVTLLEEALLPRLMDPDPFIGEAVAFHAQFQNELPDLTEMGKRAGRREGSSSSSEGS